MRGYVQHVDLVPMLFELLKINVEKVCLDGVSLLKSLETGNTVREFSYLEESYTERKYAIVKDGYKLIMAPKREDALCRYCSIVHGDIKELYDLRRDPEEQNNIIYEEYDIAKELEKELSLFHKQLIRSRLSRKIKRLKHKLSV
ncbi:MAG: hypothetical protein DRJ31_10930 [Candidatus Methanomethylicota archaeon]|uniref:N-sulphoglucosamine sulphohydrolase C-terminal domain-containing protein n=1 Tax=Thermoproteota archaeon TaxID=2056631 RepID=A0A497EJW7_9CREN|nr:MAG: hypothetical protein DRJ31_10930 [Candidatus Verstraetearchaeota archaeon]